MRSQYSDSLPDPGEAPLLALDSGSILNSVAVGSCGELLALRTSEGGRASADLLRLIDLALADAGLAVGELGGLVALRGPGSFTGLRIGLATLLGLHQALGLPATALTTFEALALEAPATERPLVAVVDALRGEWFAQLFEPGEPPRPQGPPALRRPAELAALGPCTLTGFGAGSLAAACPRARLHRPGPLAPAALRGVGRPEDWDAEILTRPLYLRAPAVTLAASRREGAGRKPAPPGRA